MPIGHRALRPRAAVADPIGRDRDRHASRICDGARDRHPRAVTSSAVTAASAPSGGSSASSSAAKAIWLRLYQALYFSPELFDRIPIGGGPGRGRHYHIADGQSTFLIMQDSTKHWTLHAVGRASGGHGGAVRAHHRRAGPLRDALRRPVEAEPAAGGSLSRRPRVPRRRLRASGDTDRRPRHEHRCRRRDRSLVEARRARSRGGADRTCSHSYEIERRQVGDRNVGASRYAFDRPAQDGARSIVRTSARTRRTGSATRDNLARVADVEQRKTNEMIGAELGYRYVGSPLIWDEPGGPEHLFREYVPTIVARAPAAACLARRRGGAARPDWRWLYAAAAGKEPRRHGRRSSARCGPEARRSAS